GRDHRQRKSAQPGTQGAEVGQFGRTGGAALQMMDQATAFPRLELAIEIGGERRTQLLAGGGGHARASKPLSSYLCRSISRPRSRRDFTVPMRTCRISAISS